MFEDFDPAYFDAPGFKEDSVREEIILPILHRLGFRVGGNFRIERSKTLSHPFIFVGTRKHPVTIIPDYTLFSDTTPILVLDAKSPSISIENNVYIQQAYSYAYHPEIRCKHFALCNGRKLTVYSTENSDPIISLNFSEYSSNWHMIENALLPKNLLKPELRNFVPDFGTQLQRIGFDQSNILVLLGVQLNLFAVLDKNTITATSNTIFGGKKHCVSFDFSSDLLSHVLAGLPNQLADEFKDALDRQPFHASAGLVVEIDIEARLGEIIKVEHEEFIPLIITKVLASRLNTKPVVDDPGDIPSHVYKLRERFVVSTFRSEEN